MHLIRRFCKQKFKKIEADKLFTGKPSQNYTCIRGVAGVRCHTILLAARHKRAHPALTPASKAGISIYLPGGMEG